MPPPLPANVLRFAVFVTAVHGLIALWMVSEGSSGDAGLAAVAVLMKGVFLVLTALSLLGVLAAVHDRGYAYALLVLPTLGLGLVALGLVLYAIE